MFNPIFHGSLLKPELFLTSYFFCFGWKNPRVDACARPLLLGAHTDCGNEREHTSTFRRSHPVTFWLLIDFSSIDFFRLIGLLSNAVLLFSECYFSMLFHCLIFSLNIHLFLPVHFHLISMIFSFNFQ